MMVLATPTSVAHTPAPVPGPEIGQPAPDFSLPDTYGTEHSLARYHGKWVVLEWLNYDCPYVGKHYRSGNIPGQQKKWTDQGVIWLAVVSSAPGKQGYFEPADMNARSAKEGSNATAVLLDPEGVLRYMGGIDDVPTARVEDLKRATQLADQALTELFAGKSVSVPTSRPYGCSVKYAS